MENSTYGLRSRRDGSGEVTRDPETYKDGLLEEVARTPVIYEVESLWEMACIHTTCEDSSSEVARTAVTCEDELISEDSSESSSRNSIVNNSMIAHLISSQLLEHFGENEPRNATLKERIISHHLIRTIQGWIENEFFDSLDTAIELQMHENELSSIAEEKEQAGEKVP